ncbi:hypothetical protein B0H14DRAFT_326932 [Mycena olivaceomarginata]|nr:hypothetical protein B0H14DRAFT_326932 [Mycena olivaceomarginata]
MSSCAVHEGSTAPARSRVLSTPSRSGVRPGAGRGCIAAHRALSSIHPRALPASPRRAHYTRASSAAVLSIGAAAGELSPPHLLPRRSCGTGLSDRSDGRRCPSSLVRDSTTPTDRPAIFSRPSVHLIYTAQGTGAHLHPVLPAGLFATHLISSRRALPHLDYTRRACSPVRRIRPSRIPTAQRGVRGGAFALRLGDVHAVAWVLGTPQAGYRVCGI